MNEIELSNAEIVAYVIFELGGNEKKIPTELGWTPSLGQDRSYIKSGPRYPQGVWC